MSANGKPLTIEFDLEKLTGQDLGDLPEAERRLDTPKIAEILARVVTKTSLGAADEPQTYLRASAGLLWAAKNRLAEAFVAEMQAEKNSEPPSTSS